MNTITLCAPVYKEPKYTVNKGVEMLRFIIDTGCNMIAPIVPEVIREYKPDSPNPVWIRALNDMAGQWWGNISEGDWVTVKGRVVTTMGWKWCYVVPKEIVVGQGERMNYAEISGNVYKDDKIVFCWDRQGVMHEELLPESEIVAIEHPFMMRTDDKRLLKVKTYGENAFKALTHNAGDRIKELRGSLNTWPLYGRGFDYALLAKEIYYGGEWVD